MNMEILLQYVTYMLAAVGVLAFAVSLITQVIVRAVTRLATIIIVFVSTYLSVIPFLLSSHKRYYRRELKRYVGRFVTFSTDEVIWGVPTIRIMQHLPQQCEVLQFL